MPSRLRWRAVRHLVRWHTRFPDPPVVRLAAGAAALVMAFVAIPDVGLATYAPEVARTPVAPPTAIDRSTGSLATISLDVMAAIRWRVIKPVRPSPSPVPTGVSGAGCDPVAVAFAQDDIDVVGRSELAALLSLAEPAATSLGIDADCVATGAVLAWYVDAQQQAAAERAAARQVALEQRRLDEQQRSARRAARRRAQRLADGRAAAERAAQRRAAAKRAAAHTGVQVGTGSGSTPSGWHNAPIVTWYGPGFYGNGTACGVKYTRTIIGVAHKTLPCGTLIRFQWHGMTAVAPVIDRGPYASAAYVFDFSAALACDVFRPQGVRNSCFTRHDVKWQVVGKVNLRQYLAAHGH